MYDPKQESYTKAEYDKLQAKNAKLKEENVYLKMLMQDIRNASDSQQAQSLLELRAENAKLKAALKKYGRHSKECKDEKYPEAWRCICGFEQALKEE